MNIHDNTDKTIHVNLKVMVMDTDFYASRALNGYLAWDRRTRVIALPETVNEAMEFLRSVTTVEYPDVLLLDVDYCATSEALMALVGDFHRIVPELCILCLSHHPDAAWTNAAYKAGARGYFVRNELRLKLVGAILYALDHPFVVTQTIRDSAAPPHDGWLQDAEVLPGERAFPEMTERIRQALWLCVVEGMPAQMAAHEMGISANTIRSYIKEGYRILENHDDTQYPEDIGPLERAFLRFTSLEVPRKPAGGSAAASARRVRRRPAPGEPSGG